MVSPLLPPSGRRLLSVLQGHERYYAIEPIGNSNVSMLSLASAIVYLFWTRRSTPSRDYPVYRGENAVVSSSLI